MLSTGLLSDSNVLGEINERVRLMLHQPHQNQKKCHLSTHSIPIHPTLVLSGKLPLVPRFPPHPNLYPHHHHVSLSVLLNHYNHPPYRPLPTPCNPLLSVTPLRYLFQRPLAQLQDQIYDFNFLIPILPPPLPLLFPQVLVPHGHQLHQPALALPPI